MLRTNHYDVAFAAFLQKRKLGHIVVDEHKRAQLAEESLKSLDFIISVPGKKHLLVDVKGRLPARAQASPQKKSRITGCQTAESGNVVTQVVPVTSRRTHLYPVANWVSTDDLEGLNRWQQQFGAEFLSVFVFAHILPSWMAEVHEHLRGQSMIHFKQEWYYFSAIQVRDYALFMQQRSPKWKTWWLRQDDFRRLSQPIDHYL